MKKIKYLGLFLVVLTFGMVGVKADETLQSKIDSADGTVKLDKNYTESIVIPEGKNVTIDLNGFDLTNATGENTITVSKGATLTMKGEGTVTNVSNSKAPIWNNGTVTIENGTYTRTDGEKNSFYVLLNHGTMTINGGEFIISNGISSLIDNGWFSPKQNTEGTMANLTINGGTFTMNNNDKYIKNDDYGNMTINGGKFEMNKPSSAVIANVGSYEGTETLIVNDGEFVYGGNSKGTGYAIWDYKWSDDDTSVTKVLGGSFNITVEGASITNVEMPKEVNEYEVLGEEDKYVIVNDEDLEYFSFSALVDKEEFDEEEVALIEKELSKYTLAGYYGVVVLASTPNEDVVDPEIAETVEPVEVKLELPNDLPQVKEGFTRKYVVIRVHNGEATVIEDVKDNGDGTVTFKSDKFSTYALAYVDEENKKEEVKEEVSPKTFDAGTMSYILLSIISIGLGGYAAFKLKKRLN